MAPRVKSLGARIATVAPRTASTMAADSWRTSGMTSAQRGYGYKWQKARAAYLAKHPFCAFCLRDMGIDYDQPADVLGEQIDAAGHELPFAHVVDHIDDHHGDQAVFWDSKNWQSLCTNHHNSEKQKEGKKP